MNDSSKEVLESGNICFDKLISRITLFRSVNEFLIPALHQKFKDFFFKFKNDKGQHQNFETIKVFKKGSVRIPRPTV